jgi:hypothetical protein
MNFKETTMIEFFIWLNILKYVESRKYKISFKISVLRPLNFDARGGRNTPLPPPGYATVSKPS